MTCLLVEALLGIFSYNMTFRIQYQRLNVNHHIRIYTHTHTHNKTYNNFLFEVKACLFFLLFLLDTLEQLNSLSYTQCIQHVDRTEGMLVFDSQTTAGSVCILDP